MDFASQKQQEGPEAKIGKDSRGRERDKRENVGKQRGGGGGEDGEVLRRTGM